MDEEIRFEDLTKSYDVPSSEVSLLDKVISLFTSVFKKDKKSSEDLEMLPSTPDTTIELEIPERSADTEMVTRESENIIELEASETSEDEKDTLEQTSGNSFSDKCKNIFNLYKKFENLTMEKVVNSHAFKRKGKTLDELEIDHDDYFIENFQYFENLPYLDVQGEQNPGNINDNRKRENVDAVDEQFYAGNSSNFGTGSIAQNSVNFNSSCSTKKKNESKEEKMNESKEKDEVKEDLKINVDKKRTAKGDDTDNEKRRKISKDNSNEESGVSSMESGGSSVESGGSSVESGGSSGESGGSSVESDYSSIESEDSSME